MIIRYPSSLLFAALAVALVSRLPAEVVINARPTPFEIQTEKYEVIVDWDGCLSHLRIDGAEFLAAGVSISRGSYFFQGGPLRLESLEQPEQHTIAAKGDAAAAKYRFLEDKMVWTVENLSQDEMVFFLVFAKELDAVRAGTGQMKNSPIAEDTHELTCIRGDASLTIKGLDRVWGPWEGSHQVAQVDLAPGESKQITLQVAPTSPDQRQAIESMFSPLPERKLTVLSPRPYQVFQRRTEAEGEVLISGRCQDDVDLIEVCVSGKSAHGEIPHCWHAIKPVTRLHQFNLRLQLPAGGWYSLTARCKRSGAVIAKATVDRFGVGEVFVGAGQSNSTNCGEFKTSQQTGMVSSFGGEHWQVADDPQPGAADNSQGGSFWPAFGDAMYEKYHVPIGVAVTGFGGTSINQWQPDGELFNWTMKRIHQLGPSGFRALLWHQGESDVGMPADEYYRKLTHVVTMSRNRAGWEFPWLVAQTSYHNPDRPSDDAIRSAQQRIWEAGVAMRGPDTDTLMGDHRDLDGKGVHFSPKGLKAHGQMWAELVSQVVDETLESEVTGIR